MIYHLNVHFDLVNFTRNVPRRASMSLLIVTCSDESNSSTVNEYIYTVAMTLHFSGNNVFFVNQPMQ